jgi:hypothetical protein
MKMAAVPSILVAVVLLALGVIAHAQQPKKVSRIGYLSSFDPVEAGSVPSELLAGSAESPAITMGIQFGWLCTSVAT